MISVFNFEEKHINKSAIDLKRLYEGSVIQMFKLLYLFYFIYLLMNLLERQKCSQRGEEVNLHPRNNEEKISNISVIYT